MTGVDSTRQAQQFLPGQFSFISFTVHLFATLPKVWIAPESRHILGAGEKEECDLMRDAQCLSIFLLLAKERI